MIAPELSVREISPTDDRRILLPYLEQDRRWSAYAICDLDPRYRSRARFIGAFSDGRLLALVLLFRLGGTHALICFGDPEATRAIFSTYDNFPDDAFIIIRPDYLGAVQERYVPGETVTVLRMYLDPADFRPAPPTDTRLTRLEVEHASALSSLYRHWESTIFDPLMLESGLYVGAFDGPDLVAVAGTHAVSYQYGIAAIGGVFTHPDHRGRGLATATTGTVVNHLLAAGIELVVLNVIADNVPAASAYRRLGFKPYHTYLEGHVSLEF